jgi:hypothetical protein
MKDGRDCIVTITSIQHWNKRKSDIPDLSKIYIRLSNSLKQINKEHRVQFPQLYF